MIKKILRVLSIQYSHDNFLTFQRIFIHRSFRIIFRKLRSKMKISFLTLKKFTHKFLQQLTETQHKCQDKKDSSMLMQLRVKLLAWGL